jgi:hypothetical protein
MATSGVIEIHRVLTGTPLARQHEHQLAGRARRALKPITWRSFDRAKYSAGALALACDAQRALASGEYGAVDLFAHIASALALHGAPFDLVAAATRVPGDEIRHADYAIQFASLLAGRDVSLKFDRAALTQRWEAGVDLERLDALMLDVAAVKETLAAALLSACRARATDPVARALFASIVSDEVHHARLGWYYLAWRAPQWSLAERQRVADRTGALVMGIERSFWHGRDAAPADRKAARALGVLESEGQRLAVASVMQDEIVPALDAFGLGASHAWRLRRRGGGGAARASAASRPAAAALVQPREV